MPLNGPGLIPLGPAESDSAALAALAAHAADTTAHAIADNVLSYGLAGTVTTGVGAQRLRLPTAVTITGVAATVGTAPTGASLIVDVNKNGTTIFTTQANRPTVAAGANVSSTAAPAVTAVAAGDYITVDVDQVGSTIPGGDLTVIVSYR